MQRLRVLIMAGLLAGCSGGGSDASDTTPASAADAADAADTEPAGDRSGCEFLTDAEVAQATGTSIASHEESGLNGCVWRAEGGTQLMFDVYSGSAVVSGTCDAQEYLGTGREEPVSGLGDSALFKTSGSLVVCTPRAVIRFNLDNSARTVPEDKEGLIQLARTVLSRV